jgi:hypothetical protein
MEKTRKLKLTNHSISGTDATRQKKLPLEIYNKKEKDI